MGSQPPLRRYFAIPRRRARAVLQGNNVSPKYSQKDLTRGFQWGRDGVLQNHHKGRIPMLLERLVSLMHRLTDKIVFAELLAPVAQALARVRSAEGLGRTLSMGDFIALGVLRHLQGMHSLREQVQALLHLDPAEAACAPLARSTWSDALGSAERLGVLAQMLPALVSEAAAVLPDRLADIPGLGARPVRAIDGTYQKESAHFRRRTPKEGGEDNPKGHACLFR